MMKRILVAVLVLLAMLLPSTSFAQSYPPQTWHDVYLQWVNTPTNRPEHIVYHKWYVKSVFHYNDWDASDKKMTLWAEDTTGSVQNTFNSAWSTWSVGGYWPAWHQYQWETQHWNADVDIFNGTCSSATADACVAAYSYYAVNPHYIFIPQRWDMKLTAGWWSYNTAMRTTVMAHELGHILGRGEAYSGSCNPSMYTIMDGISNGAHCDTASPVAWDKQTDSYQWTNGYYTYYSFVNIGGSQLQAWKDYHHNEGKTLEEWYYWNSGAGNYLNFYNAQTLPDYIGSHRSVSDAYANIDTYISFGIAPVNYGVPYYTTIKLCLTPISAGIPGERRCSPGIQYTP